MQLSCVSCPDPQQNHCIHGWARRPEEEYPGTEHGGAIIVTHLCGKHRIRNTAPLRVISHYYPIKAISIYSDISPAVSGAIWKPESCKSLLLPYKELCVTALLLSFMFPSYEPPQGFPYHSVHFLSISQALWLLHKVYRQKHSPNSCSKASMLLHLPLSMYSFLYKLRPSGDQQRLALQTVC